MNSPQDTIAAIATPLGEGGIGVVRLSGTKAIAVAKLIFRPAKETDLEQVPGHTCHYGVVAPDADIIDQALITIFRAPHSYTGEDVAEISAHGSPWVLQKILRACLQHGSRLANPGEFTQRAFLSGKLDLTQAEAVADLIRAKTDKAHAAALAQLEGRLADKIRSLRGRLLPLLAHIEVGLDHSDEGHDFLQREKLLADCRALENEINEIMASGRIGKILREGFRIALVGRPNVGKSSLLNALLKEDRAIVTPTPGTTRDTLEEGVNWDGLPVVLTDTAGVREGAQDPVEQLGIARTRKAADAADVVLGLFDSSEPLSDEDKHVIRECTSKSHIWVVNKADLPKRWDLTELQLLNGGAPTVNVSAKTGEGLDDLVHLVKEMALSLKADAGEAQWVLNVRHQDALTRAREALNQACAAVRNETFEECAAIELTIALQALGEIIGETVTEDLLDQIFSQFCIGK